LEAPTNYIGASRIFPKEGKFHYMIKDNSDCESYVPIKHKKDFVPGAIPYSLSKAVASFMIANAVRDLRGQNSKHRTMMVNISIYIDVQKRIAEQLDRYVREMQREIKNYYMTGKAALQYSSFALLKEVFDEHYSNVEFAWTQIQKALHEAVAPIVVRYVNGVRKEANYLFSEYFTTSNDNQMYQYLWDNADEIRTAAIDEIGEGYTWNNKFYNYFTDEELTDANMKDNGNKSVYIKMNTKNSNEAQVLLYVHKGKTSTVHDILEMDGYNAGEKVYLNNVKDFLKDEGYKWSSISSLYTDEEYDDLLDGESPSGSNHISINDNGTYKIHVILNGASQSNNADSSNPKTGDSIMVAVTTMTLAAAALVAVVELKKRKMI
jgi:hypothetical protein